MAIQNTAKHSVFVFIRHGDRDIDPLTSDNGLTDKGRRQAQILAELYQSGTLPSAAEFWSSPKQRCLETIKPLALKAGFQVKVQIDLDEKQSGESQVEFLNRIERLLSRAENAGTTVYFCSHGDWIPEAIGLLGSQLALSLEKGQFSILEKTSNHWRMR